VPQRRLARPGKRERDNGLFEDSREGTPQGGPLSPRISFWMSWIANLSVAATGSCATRMTVTSTCAAMTTHALTVMLAEEH
jgi:hypothetical protein